MLSTLRRTRSHFEIRDRRRSHHDLLPPLSYPASEEGRIIHPLNQAVITYANEEAEMHMFPPARFSRAMR